jgi:RND family efflux transporter MFP subunit
MKRTLTRVLVVALVVAGVALAWGLRSRNKAAPVADAPPAAGTPARPAERPIEFAASDLATVAAGEISSSIPITGTLRPTNQTMVKAKVAGEIKSLLVREGMPVKAGQEIARIDSLEYEWRVKEREAQLHAAVAQLEQARRTLENNRQLLEKNFISQNAFDNARFSFDAALGNRDAAVAQLTMAKKSLADTIVVAPMSGVVAERFAQVGEKVSPDNRIVSIVDLARMEIEAPVPASDIGSVAVGQTVSLRVEGVDTPQLAQVARINPGTQSGTRSVPVYLVVENRDPRIRAGLFAQGTLAVGTHRNVIVVPQGAVRDAAGRLYVYALDGDRLVEREVEVGLRDENTRAANGSMGVVEVTRGLAAGERIVAVNLGALRAGSPVRIAPSADATTPSGR